MAEVPEVYDLLILVDATGSMSNFIRSLQSSLPQIISISALTDSFSQIGLIAYRDYTDKDLIEWSGWSTSGTSRAKLSAPNKNVDLLSTARRLTASGGGDYPEAAKTGLAKAYEVMREDVKTIIFLYTDAPPHLISNAGGHGNASQEKRALAETNSYDGHGRKFMDWVQASRTLAMLEGGKKQARVFSILEPRMNRSDGDNYTFLSTLTEGACFYLDRSSPADIAKVTIDLLLSWMGVEKAGASVTKIAAKLSKFPKIDGIHRVKHETTKGEKKAATTDEIFVDTETIKEYLPKRKTAVRDFAERYKSDEGYRAVVVEHMSKIIEDDVSAVSLNPVFGSLWRAVCNDRKNPARDGLISSFGHKVDQINEADEKERMKNWLAESYDYSAEVQEAIRSVPEYDRYPCVYLDPTLAFVKAKDTGVADDDDNEKANQAITDFRRDELLEIGRSCDYRILRRLGRILTRLTFIENSNQLPAHIADAEEGVATRIPLALAEEKYGRKLWRILLHIVIPGTMLSARPAALLATLAIGIGVKPLYDAADAELLLWRNKWNNIDVPETWNTSCLSLLLDADKSFRDRHTATAEAGSAQPESRGLLKASDRKLFNRLVSYMLLERNVSTTLLAKVGWKPEKTTMSIGPLVICYVCHYPRSVTVMGPRGKCGICAHPEPTDPKERQVWTDGRVSTADTPNTNATWVECSVRTCRAQYIVYHPDALNVRAKCHYCREQSYIAGGSKKNESPAPCLECEKCLSRVIFPKEYRNCASSPYQCVACSEHRKTIVELETTAKALSNENGSAWLLENKDGKLKDPFSGRSLFHQISTAGIEDFCSKVALFPDSAAQRFTLDGKPLHNTAEVVQQLRTWVSGRRIESGTCSLCFSSKRKADFHPACGRQGCEQRVCRDCLSSWYGLNAAGRIINTAALNCPFCKRTPTAKTLHRYGMGIHAVGDLREAVENAGQWVYAWCIECAKAKQFVERICARGAPPELENWQCQDCIEQREAELRRAAEELRLEEERLEHEGRRMTYERRAILERAIEAARAKKSGTVGFKECPSCGVMTEKTYGCGHMECRCRTHWCWFCGNVSTKSEIYRHMDEVHGSFYEEGDVGDDDDLDEL
ncbi:hypothetical protein MMC25_003178 [Agyrium rufum]|nr:hypothetical protein [Agyrium rufum]